MKTGKNQDIGSYKIEKIGNWIIALMFLGVGLSSIFNGQGLEAFQSVFYIVYGSAFYLCIPVSSKWKKYKVLHEVITICLAIFLFCFGVYYIVQYKRLNISLSVLYMISVSLYWITKPCAGNDYKGLGTRRVE